MSAAVSPAPEAGEILYTNAPGELDLEGTIWLCRATDRHGKHRMVKATDRLQAEYYRVNGYVVTRTALEYERHFPREG